MIESLAQSGAPPLNDRANEAVLIVCMGVSGSGKTTIARGIANRFGLSFLDADDEHSVANKRKMASGVPLSDADRVPWMEAVIRRLITQKRDNTHCVLAHSGLRHKHRKQIREAGLRTMFLHLSADRDTLSGRLAARGEQFFDPALLDSQLQILECPNDEPDCIPIDVRSEAAVVTTVVDKVVAEFLGREGVGP